MTHLTIAASGHPDPLEEHADAIGINREQPIDTAAKRLHAWALVASSGINMLRVDDVLYCWDARPRAQRRGRAPVDVGGYKIDADGRVAKIPRDLAGVLPGTEAAEISDDAEKEQTS